MTTRATGIAAGAATKNIKSSSVPTGIIYDASETRMGEVRDGTTNTYLIGEKFVYTDQYENAGNGDKAVLYAGVSGDANNSNFRSAGNYDNATYTNNGSGTVTISSGSAYAPTQDRISTQTTTSNAYPYYAFGGPHAGSFGMGMADGSCQWVSYSIDPSVHACLANRKDGMASQIPQ